MARSKVEICLKKKPPRAQTFRYFRIESRNSNSADITHAGHFSNWSTVVFF